MNGNDGSNAHHDAGEILPFYLRTVPDEIEWLSRVHPSMLASCTIPYVGMVYARYSATQLAKPALLSEAWTTSLPYLVTIDVEPMVLRLYRLTDDGLYALPSMLTMRAWHAIVAEHAAARR